MTFNKAKNLLTSIGHNLDGGMKYSYDLTKPNKFELKMYERNNDQPRILTFKLKKGIKRIVYVKFICHGFRFNFPLKKNAGGMSFHAYDFAKLLTYGIKTKERTSNIGLDLDVEF